MVLWWLWQAGPAASHLPSTTHALSTPLATAVSPGVKREFRLAFTFPRHVRDSRCLLQSCSASVLVARNDHTWLSTLIRLRSDSKESSTPRQHPAHPRPSHTPTFPPRHTHIQRADIKASFVGTRERDAACDSRTAHPRQAGYTRHAVRPKRSRKYGRAV